MFLHKAIDLADWEAAGFAVLQRHGNQAAKNKIQQKEKSVFRCFREVGQVLLLNLSERWLTCRSKLASGKTWAAGPDLEGPDEVV